MKKVLLATLILFSFGCQEKKQAENNIVKEDSVSKDTMAFTPPTTAMQVVPLRSLPAPFVLDSITNKDSTRYKVIEIYFPVSKEDKGFNIMIQSYVQQYAKEFTAQQLNGVYDNAIFSMWPISAVSVESLIGFCFIDQSYYPGAGHFTHRYATFNYDKVKRKRIFFTDLFSFPSEKSRQKFCDLFNEFKDDGNVDSLNIKDLNKERDFQITGGRLVLYFDDYEKDPSMREVKIDLARIHEFINPVLGKEYGLMEYRISD